MAGRRAIVATDKNIGDDAERAASLDRELAELGRRFDRGSGALDWEYLLVTARKKG